MPGNAYTTVPLLGDGRLLRNVALREYVAVETKLRPLGKVGTVLEKQRAEVFVHTIKVGVLRRICGCFDGLAVSNCL